MQCQNQQMNQVHYSTLMNQEVEYILLVPCNYPRQQYSLQCGWGIRVRFSAL